MGPTSNVMQPLMRFRFALENTAVIAIKAKPQTESTLRYLNMTIFMPLTTLESSKHLRKIWRVGFYESKEFGPIKPLFVPKVDINLEAHGTCLRIA